MNILHPDDITPDILTIYALRFDPKAAHLAEIKLYLYVLRAIADGRADDPRKCAERVIETQKIDFPRRCA